MFIRIPCLVRNDLPKILESNFPKGVGVEVGVWLGHYSRTIIDNWSGTLHLVDPWERLDDYDDIRNTDFNPEDYQTVCSNFSSEIESGRIILQRCVSSLASTFFDDESLDFVYIDANHAYKHVVQDLTLWYPKLKKGGIIAGHDIFSGRHPQVTEAVEDFFKPLKLSVFVTDPDKDSEGNLVNAASYFTGKV